MKRKYVKNIYKENKYIYIYTTYMYIYIYVYIS